MRPSASRPGSPWLRHEGRAGVKEDQMRPHRCRPGRQTRLLGARRRAYRIVARYYQRIAEEYWVRDGRIEGLGT
jgi:hypothetical protein